LRVYILTLGLTQQETLMAKAKKKAKKKAAKKK